MADSTPTPQDISLTDAKQAFINLFPARLALLNNYTKEGLRANAVDPYCVTKLTEQSQELANRAGRFELKGLCKALSTLASFFHSVRDELNLDSSRSQELELLLKNLRHEFDQTRATPADALAGAAEHHVYLLCNDPTESLPDGLESELASRSYTLVRLQSKEHLLRQMREERPDALIIHISLLPGLMNELTLIKNQLSEFEQRAPLIFYGRSDNLEQHLLSLRSGADAYLAFPAKPDYLANKIVSLIQTQNLHFRVLIIEDDPAQADYAAGILRKAGMEVIALTKPMMAVRVLQDFEPDLILMDLYMPDASGKELTSILRENDKLLATPIVYLSGEQDTDKKIDALSAGGDDFLTKPIRPHHLINTVTNRIRRTRALRGIGMEENSGPQRDAATGLLDKSSFIKEVNGILKSDTVAEYIALLYLQLEAANSDRPFIDLPQAELILADVSNIICDNLLGRDIPARLERNSFAILLEQEGTRSTKKLSHILLALIESHHFGTSTAPVRINCRIGIAYMDKDSTDAVHLISEAVFASSETTPLSESSMASDAEFLNAADLLKEQLLQSALDDQQIQFEYLPMLQRRKGEEVQLMQLRLKAPDRRGHYVVHHLLSRLQNQALLSAIDNHALGTALERIGDDLFEGRETNLIVPMSQNMLMFPENTLWLREQLRKTQLVGSRLMLVFRLPDAALQLKNAYHAIKSLRQLGTTICLSQFQGSATHFKVVKALKPNYVSIASRILEKADQRAITALAHNLEKLDVELCLFPPENDLVIPDAWLRYSELVPKHN